MDAESREPAIQRVRPRSLATPQTEGNALPPGVPNIGVAPAPCLNSCPKHRSPGPCTQRMGSPTRTPGARLGHGLGRTPTQAQPPQAPSACTDLHETTDRWQHALGSTPNAEESCGVCPVRTVDGHGWPSTSAHGRLERVRTGRAPHGSGTAPSVDRRFGEGRGGPAALGPPYACRDRAARARRARVRGCCRVWRWGWGLERWGEWGACARDLPARAWRRWLRCGRGDGVAAHRPGSAG